MEANFLDEFWVGERLQSVVEFMGEPITFNKDTDNEIHCKACFDDGVNDTAITAHTVYKTIGEIIFPYSENVEGLRGSYFVRDKFPDKKYILATTMETPFNDRLANVEVYECNNQVNIVSMETKLNPTTGNEEEVISSAYGWIDVFQDTKLQSPMETQIGNISQTTITIIVPSSYPLSTGNKMLLKEFKSISSSPIPMYSEQSYKIDDVDYTFATTSDGINFLGVFRANITKDI